MGDHRAGTSGPTATTVTAPQTDPPAPYAGRRVAQVVPTPVETTRGADALPYRGRRVAGRNPVVVARVPADQVLPTGRRIALDPELTGLADDADDVVGHLLRPTTPTTLEGYVGRRIARPTLITEPTVVKPVVIPPPADEPLSTEPAITPMLAVPVVDLLEDSLTAAPAITPPSPDEPVLDSVVVEEPVREQPAVDDLVDQLLAQLAYEGLSVEEPVVPESPAIDEPVHEEAADDDQVVVEVDAVELVEPVLAAHPELEEELPKPAVSARSSDATRDRRVSPKQTRPGGRRVANRRTRVPSLPLLAGVAVLAISAGGALQAAHPSLSGADADGRISPASALSGSSAVGSANLLGGRDTSVSRDANRQTLSGNGQSLQAAADKQAKARDAALSALAGKAEKQAAQIKLHQWVLPVTPGVYHLTARFGDYSSLWAHFHTGLDFAAPTGTPIMAVAGGTITEVGYSGAYGNRTIETLPDGTELWYCHQNEFGTSVGATVKPGQVIGYIGSTGNVTGPHLHLEVHPGGGDPVDPYTALQVHGLNP